MRSTKGRIDESTNSSRNPSVRQSGHSSISSHLIAVEVLELVLDVRHELVRDGAVNQTVIEPERQVRHGPNRNRIVDDDRAFLDCAHTENRDLGLVDDRHPELRAKLAGISDREGAALHFLRLELLASGAV